MFQPDYLVFLVTFAAIYGIFSLGLNLHWGFTGLLNFGHAGFMAVGAYTTILLGMAGLPILLAIVLGGIAAALLALIMGFSTLRLREDYLAIVTIGFSELIRLFVKNEKWLTGGDFGINNIAIPLAEYRPNIATRYGMIALFSVVVGLGAYRAGRHLWQQFQQNKGKLAPAIWLFGSGAIGLYIYSICVRALLNFNVNEAQKAQTAVMFWSVLALGLFYAALETLVRSPWGRVLKSIREDEEVPRALGKNVFFYKLQSLMIGGFITGVGAVLNAWQLSNIYPKNFDTQITFAAWIVVVLGGAGSNAGTILGAAIFWLYQAVTRDLDKVLPFLQAGQIGALRVMVIGLILMVLMIWRPQGILGNKDELTLGR
jgi:neutral amino acid transport system permease protein